MSYHQENACALSVVLDCVVEYVELDIDENKSIDTLHTHTYDRGREFSRSEQG
jgi:hypothetical protein